MLMFVATTLLLFPASGAYAVDTDGDGIDDELDNCINAANGPLIPDAGGNSQLDTDGDGFGNICDPDFNGNTVVDPGDFSLIKSLLGSPTSPNQDLNGNGAVDPADFSITKSFLGQPPGPSCITTTGCVQAQNPTARGDSYATPQGDPLSVPATRLSGVLYNDFDPQNDPLTAVNLNTTGTLGSVTLGPDGSFTYIPPAVIAPTGPQTIDDTFTYQASDGTNLSDVATVNVRVVPKQTDFKFMMNYELGMHCTGFEFAYCCVLPVYNSIVAQVVKPEPATGVIQSADDMAKLLEADPNLGRNLDVLGRETVLRDPTLVGAGSGTFPKYVVKYWHEAQSRNDGQGKPQVGNPALQATLPGYLDSRTLISDVEGNSLLSWNTRADAVARNVDGSLMLGGSECTNPADATTPPFTTCAAINVMQGDGDYGTLGGTFGVPVDNYQNAIWNHLYIYADTEGTRLCANDTTVQCHDDADCAAVGGVCGDSTEANKVRLGLDVDYPTNFGPGGHPMGPVSGGAYDNDRAVLTFSEDTGTVVYTQMKLVENLPITLTSPRMWEALGLPLTPFEDTLGFFADPGLVDEDSIRPYVQMTAQLHDAICAADGSCVAGPAVIGSTGQPVQGFGDAPIDIPNCERCHSAFDAPNSPNVTGEPEADLVQLEIDFWKAFYDIDVGAGDADWYARLKGAAISILAVHDTDHNTRFLANFPAVAPVPAGTPFSPATELGGLSEPFPNAPAVCIDPVLKTPTTVACASHAQCETAVGAGSVCDLPQNTRIGHDSVLCHKCHADNVIAVVKSADCGPNGTSTDANGVVTSCAGELIPALSQSLHHNHRSVSEGGPIVFNDGLGRDGSCQGCHPAHRSDGVMDDYPITLEGNNIAFSPVFDATKDNRLAQGGCFVGRDVHSNPLKDVDATTPNHMNVVGQYLRDNVVADAGEFRGIWCTNCHTQLGQEMWKQENVADLINGLGACAGDGVAGLGPDTFCSVNADCDTAPGNGVCALNNVRTAATIPDLALALNTTVAQVESWLDPKDPAIDPDLPLSGLGARANDDTYAIWRPDTGLCDYVVQYVTGTPIDPAFDGAVATIEVVIGNGVGACSLPGAVGAQIDCGPVNGGPAFQVCVTPDADGDPTVNVLPPAFCTTPDCVATGQASLDAATGGSCTLAAGDNCAVPVPFSTSTITTASDGRDHWLAPGEPHCADCHAAPYVEQSGNINAFAPFNYPRKASLMRYSRGHQDITCQGCHESIHGLYPVTPTIDNTSYAQAAALNHDGTHGPLKCGTCHQVDGSGIPTLVCGPGDTAGKCDGGPGIQYAGAPIEGDIDASTSWAHTFTDEASPLAAGGLCTNCHGDESGGICGVGENCQGWLEHSMEGRVTRTLMDKTEIEANGSVFTTTNGINGVCTGCHGNESGNVSCNNREWKEHLTEGRVAQSVWEQVTALLAAGQPAADGTLCGW
jgi:VCBS repeat-containing protein